MAFRYCISLRFIGNGKLTRKCVLNKFIYSLALIGMTAHVSASEAIPSQFAVPGSSDHDFAVECRDNGNVTFSINKNKSNDYRNARNIVFTNMGDGRVAISLLHGFGSADKPSTYLTSSTERCEAYKQ
jgi:hypothetical protein